MTAEFSTQDMQRFALVRPLFDDEIALAVCNPLGDPVAPLDEEAACLSPNAVVKRRNEFAAGRQAAHQAMALLGVPVQPVPVGANRAPIWPQGLVGSISHTRSCAMAVIAHHGAVQGLGIDVEEDKPLAPDLWPAICSDREQTWLHAQENPGQMAKLIFSAKEAAYKCQFAVSERYYGFDGMELEVDTAENRFLARFCADQSPFSRGDYIAGRFAIGAGVIITTALLRS